MRAGLNSLLAVGFALAAAGCATTPIMGDPAVPVFATAETEPVGTTNDDAADDPAIWRNAANPAKSLIVGTDKKAGLHVYDLEGRDLAFLGGGLYNNVDLVELPDGRVLVAASDRTDPAQAHILLAMLDTQSRQLTRIARVAVGEGEGYGICMGEPAADGTVDIFSAPKNGTIYRTRIALEGTAVSDTTSILATVPSQPEGCVVDPRTATLYVGEEAAGIWAIDTTTGDKRLVAAVDNALLVADVEGLALAPDGEDGGYLVASSQGDSAFAVFELPGMRPLGRFRVAQGTLGAVEETDGIALDPRDFGPGYEDGLFIAQDGINPPSAQNFKLVPWGAVLEALKSPASTNP
ncbi:3-phytase [Alteriqipengyuania lutimaris]|uniref:3-phytase n=2 Tax=Alteriqipengyuania lutimaris TaxID=1538146 RepID=A0A395LK95_9SPHN|nr:3-phytase [Alteriqipengyuania lutimaris]